MAAAVSSGADLVGVSAVAGRSAAAVGVAEACAEIGAGSVADASKAARAAASVSVSSPVLRAPSVPYTPRPAATLREKQIAHSFQQTFVFLTFSLNHPIQKESDGRKFQIPFTDYS